ncbi:carbohydrate ABC transporter permease [Niameybacter massiliensis]|uniref:Carbohydrate ABC transporter permease n=1 Tax=Holtiella tumoricola TaxID=3018743 RepID=A0AA42DJE6_9FIRM|nr:MULTISPECIES: carbohydrate ABC transporter permease [Lachnospirales]MDA3729974.1 carbohydrate ABC transporter permease [Holtiella tumoricola]
MANKVVSNDRFVKARELKSAKIPWDGYRIKKEAMGIGYKLCFYSLILGLCFVILYPMLKLFPLVFGEMADLGNPDVIWIPKEFSLLSFKAAFKIALGGSFMGLIISLLYALSMAVIQVFMSAMAGYSLARIDFKGRNIIFALVVLTFLVPPQALLISQYLHFKQFDIFGLITLMNGSTIDLINKPFVLYILAFLGFGVKQGLFIFIFRQFFITMPNEFEEAAVIDGCGFYRTYFKIMFPNAMPPIMTVGVLSFVWNYGDVYYTNYFHPDGPYLSVVLQRLFGAEQRDRINSILFDQFNVFLTSQLTFDATKQAALIIFLIPLLIVYFIVQRNLVESLERSGIVG